MRLQEARALFDEFEYPISLERLAHRTRDRTLVAPVETTETVGEVLRRTDATTVRSPAEAQTLLVGNVGDAYVGRKHYDDRGPNPGPLDHVSF